MRLLPSTWKWPGVLLSLAGMTLGAMSLFGGYEIAWLTLKIRQKAEFLSPAVENFTEELALTLLIAGLLILAFTREKDEDERVRLIRLEAFQWSILANFIIVLAGNWSLYGEGFFYLMVFNLFTPLVVFLLRFYYVLYVSELRAEKSNSAAL
jgi:hypothetical protein